MLPTLFVIVTFLVLYWFPIRRWMNQWGATPSDVARVMGVRDDFRNWLIREAA